VAASAGAQILRGYAEMTKQASFPLCTKAQGCYLPQTPVNPAIRVVAQIGTAHNPGVNIMRLSKYFDRRKNYLFAGSDTGRERAAAIYSLLGSAKLSGSIRRRT
jgi:hypothetical protein